MKKDSVSIFSPVVVEDLKLRDLVFYYEEPFHSRRYELKERLALAQILYIAPNGGIVIHHLNYVDKLGLPLDPLSEASLRIERRPLFNRIVNSSDLMIQIMSSLFVYSETLV